MSVNDPQVTLILRLAPNVIRTWFGLAGITGQTQLTDRPLMDALERGASLAHLLDVGTPRAGHDVAGVLDVLHRRQLLAWQAIDADGTAWATLTAIRSGVPLPLPDGGGGGHLRLSRFALLRRSGDTWLLESGRSSLAATLSPRAAAAVAAEEGPPQLCALLQVGRLLVDSDDDGPSRYWEFHDRYFASRSRFDAAGAGATFRFSGVHHPESADAQPPLQGPVIPLPVPDLEDAGPALWEVTERRRSHPEVSDEPIDLQNLGALLWRTLRVTNSAPRDPLLQTSYDAAFKPVPSGGGTHSIGLWLACRHVTGLEPGTWWYDAVGHALVRTDDLPRDSLRETHPVYGLLISRHARLAWKYERIAYALALKDAGVILHALQLGATALGLAMCPIGSGPTAPILEAFGLDEDSYAPVGEFWLARRR